MRHLPKQLQELIAHFKKLPGVGRKTAERYAFHLLEWPEQEIQQFSLRLAALKETITSCPTCGCLQEMSCCYFCHAPERDCTVLCLVSSPKDVYAIEETGVFKGLYHVLGGLLSPMEGREISREALDKLKKRIEMQEISEVILALDSTLEGDATSLFLKKELDSLGTPATRLAFGLPMGSALDFVDYGTLEKAFTGRQRF